ncbi:MAG: polyphenol oxidase family protein [Acidimicrobiales bacterium]
MREVQWLEQVHGAGVVVARLGDGGATSRHRSVRAGRGDALVSADPSVAVAVLTADCAPIALGSEEGVFAAVHAGWRGLVAGVVEAAVATMRSLGATEVDGALGPCIHAGCYEFSENDLAALTERLGPAVRATTGSGRPAFDLPAAVSAAFASSGVREVAGVDDCTACGDGYFSHRSRRDQGRQALVVWAGGAVRSG